MAIVDSCPPASRFGGAAIERWRGEEEGVNVLLPGEEDLVERTRAVRGAGVNMAGGPPQDSAAATLVK